MEPSATMTMASVVTSTSAAAAAATSSGMANSGMDMGGGSGDGTTCEISMLWNWYTVDACFLAQSWHISSHGVFAVSCIGVVLLVVSLEFLRRLGKTYDQYLQAQFRKEALRRASASSIGDSRGSYQSFRYTPLQQLLRSIVHMTTFGVAYLIMLLAMYFNGYIIISILIGALLGKFVCDWEIVTCPGSESADTTAGDTRELAKGEQELTYCCG